MIDDDIDNLTRQIEQSPIEHRRYNAFQRARRYMSGFASDIYFDITYHGGDVFSRVADFFYPGYRPAHLERRESMIRALEDLHAVDDKGMHGEVARRRLLDRDED